MPLQVGAVGTSVEVSAGATLIETETARISDTKGAMELKTLPLNTRGMWAFLALAPTVLQSSSGSTIRFAGSGSNQSHWAIDGTTMSDGVDETQIGPLANYIESFQEVKIDSANNTAEFSTIGQVTIVSKSGTNQFHGAVFDYYSTPWFRARNPFALARAGGVSHAPGAGVGGPILIPKLYNGRNRTFFYFSFETSRGSSATDILNPTVPLPAWRDGNFSGLSTLIYDPATGAPFPGNVIPGNRINPVSKLIQDRFYPLPNFGSNTVLASQNFRQNLTRPWDPSTYFVPRVDHKFSDKDSIFGRFTFFRAFNRTYEGNLPTIGRRFQQRDNRGATISETHIFSPALTNEFRWGFALNNNPVIGPLNGPQQVKELGLVGLAPDLPDISGMLQLSWTGIGLTGLTQPNYTNPGFRNHLQEFQDHVSWFRGRHNVKFGLNFTRVEYDSLTANANLFGNVGFSNRFTSLNQAGAVGGHPYADFLLGIPTTASRAFAPVRFDANRWQYDFFAADDFKINSHLTLNMGLRYEMHLPWRENANRMAMFDIGSASIVVPDGMSSKVSPLFPKNYVPIIEASKAGLPSRTLLRADRNNVAPRIGIAYRPWSNRTVFRAGYGIFYDVVPRTLTLAGLPYVLNEPSYTNPITNPDVVFPRVFPSTGVSGPSTVGIPTAYNPNLRIPYSMQYNFTIEHQAWDTGFRMSYVGTAGRKTEYAYNFNQPVADNRLYVNKPRPFPQYPNFNYITNGAGHQYNSLTFEAQRSMAKGLYFQGSYTLARDIFDLTRGGAPEDAYNRVRERAVAQDIPTHRVNVNYVYELPYGTGRKYSSSYRAVNMVAGGWQITGIYSLYSGQFLTPLWNGPDPTGTAFTNSTSIPLVTIRPDILRDPNLPSDERTVNRWFDVGAFGAPGAGRFGTSAKGVIKGPGTNVWHMGLAKNIPFGERARLRAEITATNIFNHPQWSNPGLTITAAANSGIITGVGGVNGSSTGDQPGPRAFRASLRFEF